MFFAFRNVELLTKLNVIGQTAELARIFGNFFKTTYSKCLVIFSIV
jgi:hypothetical protein